MVVDEPKIAPRKLLRSKRALVINAGVFLLLTWAFADEWTANHELSRQVAAKTAEAESMQREYDETNARMDQLSGTAVAEREARLKLNMRRPDEEVYVVRGLETEETVAADAVTAEASAEPATPVGNVATWWHYFFK
jgi:cell division protein FtsB